MPIETYEEALDFWSSRTNYEQIGMPTDLRALKLDRIRAVPRGSCKPPERGMKAMISRQKRSSNAIADGF